MLGPKAPPQTPAQAEEAFNKAVDAARGSDVAVLVLGELANMSGEGASCGLVRTPRRRCTPPSRSIPERPHYPAKVGPRAGVRLVSGF